MAIREKLDETIEENRILRERDENNDYEREIKKLQNNALMNEVTTAQKARESQCPKLAQEIEKLSMDSKQKESEDEFSRVERAFDHQAAELGEKRPLNNLMSDSVSTCIMTNK